MTPARGLQPPEPEDVVPVVLRDGSPSCLTQDEPIFYCHRTNATDADAHTTARSVPEGQGPARLTRARPYGLPGCVKAPAGFRLGCQRRPRWGVCSSRPRGWGQGSGPRVTEPRDWAPAGGGPGAALHSVCCEHTATCVTRVPQGRGLPAEGKPLSHLGAPQKRQRVTLATCHWLEASHCAGPLSREAITQGPESQEAASLGPLSQLLPQRTVQQPGVPRNLRSITSSRYPPPDIHLSALPSQTELRDQPRGPCCAAGRVPTSPARPEK